MTLPNQPEYPNQLVQSNHTDTS